MRRKDNGLTTAKFRRRLARLGGLTAEISTAGRTYDVTVDTPDGFRFSGTGTHCLVHETPFPDEPGEPERVRREALADAIANLPLEVCPDPECDVCRPPVECMYCHRHVGTVPPGSLCCEPAPDADLSWLPEGGAGLDRRRGGAA
jgi:hypothetical protein